MSVETRTYETVEQGGAIVSEKDVTRQEIILEWKDISLTVVNKSGEQKALLHPMSGIARPGEILAVMGSSGAGKSTLLDVLASRLESSSLKGEITTNGFKINKSTFRRESGYVMQSDALFPLLTVRETLQYAASLRIHGMSTAEKMEEVESVIKLLRIERCADTIVGDNDNRGVSGGEKRRVSIGVDIVHKPSVIFLDEPTSGLDSSTAFSVIDSLRELALVKRCTIALTIHQPSAKLFAILDNVIFLSAGKVTYSGPTAALQEYINQSYKQADLGDPPIANPPEVFLELTDILTVDNKLDIVSAKYAKNDIDASSSSVSDVLQDIKAVPVQYANGLVFEVAVLVHRAYQNVVRTKELFGGRLGACVGFGVLVGTLFLQNNATSSNANLDWQSAYFVFTIAFFMYTSLEALPVFLAEREIFQREYSRGAYRAFSYTLASLLVFFPFMLIIASVYSLITWWLVGLANIPGLFFYNVFTIFTILVTGTCFATMFSVLVPNPMVGQTAGSALFSVMFLFSGFFIPKDQIPNYWIWLYYLSLFQYAYSSLVVNAFKGGNVSTSTMTNEQVLTNYSVNGVDRGAGVAVLWGFVIFFRFIFYYRLTTVFNGSRK